MLNIHFDDDSFLDWDIQESVHCENLEKIPVWINASGRELEYIEKRFTNIPMVKDAGYVCWRGNMARFIFDNMGWMVRYPNDF